MKTSTKLAIGSLILTAACTCWARNVPGVSPDPGEVIEGLPDPQLTPGAINSKVTQDNIHQTVCMSGWTKTVRPPVAYTNNLKQKQIKEYGYADTNPRDYEEDHLIPLALGGNPTDEHNLWPQPRNSAWNAAKKDKLEFALYKAVCSGEYNLDKARDEIKTNWIKAYLSHPDFLEHYKFKYGSPE